MLDHLLARLCEHFGASAAALALDSGERFGTHAGDPAWPAAGERIELEVQDGLGAVGVLDLAFAATPPDHDERTALELVAARIGRTVARLRHEREAAVAEGSLRAENRAAGRLYRISTALMAERELQDVVQRVTDESTALSGAQFGAFFYNVLDGRGGRVEECHVASTLLGITGAPEFTDAAAELASGDALVLYTVGLIEARSADGILGEERVRELLAGGAGATAEDLAGALAALAAEFGSKRRDDLALLVARAI